MARFRKIKNVFSSGELSPKLHKLAGLEEYQKGLAEQLNQISIRTGGSFSRPGTRRIRFLETYDVLTESIQDSYFLIPIDSDSDKGNQLAILMIFSKGGNSGYFIRLVDTTNGEYIRTATYNSYGQLGYEGEEFPWDTNESAEELQWVQFGNTIVMVHPSGKFQPMVVQLNYIAGIENYPEIDFYSWMAKFTAPNFFVGDLIYSYRLPHGKVNPETSVYLKLSAAYNNEPTAILQAVDSGGTLLTYAYFNENYVGKTIELEYVAENQKLAGTITAFTSNTITIEPMYTYKNNNTTIAATTKSNVFWVSEWGGPRDLWPRVIGFYEERLIMASTLSDPEKIWISNLNDYAFFMNRRSFLTNISAGNFVPLFNGDALTTDPFDIIPADGGIVTWLNSQDKLYIGSYIGESIGGGIQFQFSNSQAFVKNQDNKGGRRIKTERTNDGVIFIGRDGKQLLQFKFSNNGSHVSRNLSLLADHLVYHNTTKDKYTDITFKQIAWANSMSILWVLTTENQLLGITIDPDTNTLGWHRHIIGGDAEILSIAATQGKTEDDLLLICKRSHQSSLREINIEKISGYKESFNLDTRADIFTINDLPLEPGNKIPGITYSGFETSRFINENDLPWYLDSSSYYILPSPSNQFILKYCNFDPTGLTEWQPNTVYNIGDIVSIPQFQSPSAPSLWGWRAIFNHTSDPADPLNQDFLWEKIDPTRKVRLKENTIDKPVSVIADGIYIGVKQLETINLGLNPITNLDEIAIVLNLDQPATNIIIGYNFTKRIKTLPMEVGSQIGDSLEPIKRIDRVQISLYKSKGGSYGSEENDLKPLEYTGDPNLLETTDFVESFPSSNDRTAQVILEEEGPYPMNVIALSMRGVLHDG